VHHVDFTILIFTCFNTTGSANPTFFLGIGNSGINKTAITFITSDIREGIDSVIMDKPSDKVDCVKIESKRI
jgi:hypothetical protein